MNYSDIIQQIDSAAGFDLYRLHSAIGRMLDDPKRIMEVKMRVRPGDKVEYFDPSGNAVVRARLLKFQRTRVIVENLDDGRRWEIPYYALNIHGVDARIVENRAQGLGRNEVSVGDRVGFVDRQGEERYGQITRLNQKTVTLQCENGIWRVAYGLLFQVVDPQAERLPHGN